MEGTSVVGEMKLRDLAASLYSPSSQLAQPSALTPQPRPPYLWSSLGLGSLGPLLQVSLIPCCSHPPFQQWILSGRPETAP